MPLSDFLHDLRQLERAASAQHGSLILEAFARHTPFGTGAVYFRDRDTLRLAAKSANCVAPEIVDGKDFPLDPRPSVIVPLRAHRDDFGFVALSAEDTGGVTEDDLEIVRAA